MIQQAKKSKKPAKPRKQAVKAQPVKIGESIASEILQATGTDAIATAARRKVGRPRKQYSKATIDRVAECAFSGCQTNTIAMITGLTEEELRGNFTELMQKKRAERKLWLRSMQNEHVKNNPIVGIFLGKNELGQADKQEIDVNASRLPESTEELRALLQEREAREARVKAIVANIEADNA